MNIDPGIAAALIAAVVAAASAAWSTYQGIRLKRISYEYEARKRLYVEVGALQFQLGEAAEDARQRVVSLARSGRKGALAPANNWLAVDGYYMRTTVYYLFAPLAILRLIQRRLTSTDLDIDARVKAQYQLLRVLSWSFSEGHELAAVEGFEHRYDPVWDEDRWGELADEAKERPQHLPLGNIAKPVEALVVEGAGDAPPRILSYGEFVRDLDDKKSEVSRRFVQSQDINPFKLFRDFHPERRPVLWRILAYQLLLYDALLTVGRIEKFEPKLLESYLEPTRGVAQQCRWREGQPIEEAMRPFEAAHAVLSTKLAGVRNPLLRR